MNTVKSTLVPLECTYVAPEPEGPVSIADWLMMFGAMSPDAIARYFRDGSILGTPRDPHDCGFAVFLARVTGRQDIHVDGTAVNVHYTGQSYPMPASCRTFVSMFDRGHYPYLYKPDTYRFAADPIPKWLVATPAPVTVTLKSFSFNVPAGHWDDMVVKFSDLQHTELPEIFGVPASLLTAPPVEVPELVGA